MNLALILLLGSSLAETTWSWTYHYSNMTMNWTEAREFCRSNYTDLVIFRSQIENDYVVSILPNRSGTPYYWIGITKTHMTGPWTWVGNNSTWTGNKSWAKNEPNNNHVTEYCVEIYVNDQNNRGKWNDEKCSHEKYPVCYKAQCNQTSCNRGTCWETIENTTCECEAGFKGDRCQTAVECDSLPQPDNGDFICTRNRTFNSTCQLKCHFGFLLVNSTTITCDATSQWSGPRPACISYKQALMAMAGSGAISTCCICFCWMKRRKRKKLAQARLPGETTSTSSETHI